MRVLVLEDEVFVSMELEEELSCRGHEVIGPAGTLEEAHALLEQGSFEVAILDANIRGETPLAIAEELRRRGVPFLYLSGYDETYIREHLPDAPLLSKPLRVDALVKLLSELVNRTESDSGSTESLSPASAHSD